MQVQEAIASRRSVRDFLPTPVPGETIRRVLAQALRAPSGGNLQPWYLHVVGGERLDALKALMRERLAAGTAEEAEYDVYPRELLSPYRDRRFQVGEDMYATMGVPREDKPARRRWFARNYEFFGAPLALFCTMDKRHGPPQWSDAGMLLQTLMLLLRAEGLDSCPQEAWAVYPQTLREFLGIPEERMLFTGMAIGYANPAHPVNSLVAQRAPLEEVVSFEGI
ncbi:MAG TPA: nitroreductase [Ideonella sp.]|uniref:nitroreductase n=1 Tax=Ideonella sp. TaxID=1929293 RepID=UPI002C5660EC|nr:nitroreductase [Ideonella sp.]HSI47501.1 nitroreductase [Ideonella sp.]